LAIEKCTVGEVYNLGSGQGYKISWLLNKLIKISGKKIEVKGDKNKLRPVDNPVTICNCDKFIKTTGWKVEIPIEKTLEDILDYWKKRV
ncbi:MAG: GDP-mannose 4,6 dehydratase, partial [Candidatus Heimdallarchaeota archaeon]